ncbi:ABC transporter ATP-binding protein [Dermatobacter hominis]|uniref:ABC transporter ATP-binding protein n=1 Tax=Dermatobacter hominis TaxID=2884263 RepID=UPI001D11C4A7|nr:ABC transporter ATP-binding protein [Dermatobacter hominis]UDY34518.1 ABC transporter ATP-binding protein [Dermatobacter hominis]
MSVIEVEDLQKSYGDVEAVRGLSFSVEEGEILAVLGPNGAGKTTTVEILEGYRTRDSGSVAVLGLDPAHGGTELRGRIGIVLQECGVDPFLTVSEVLRKHAEYYRHPRDVDEVISLVGLDEKADERVKRLSGGQQRRLDVALGLIGDPELLFLDEPTTGFDPTARRQAWEIVRNLGELGKTVLLTTHYMDEAQALADRVVVIAGGRIVAEGTPQSIGGRAEADVTVEFRLPPGVGPADLPVAVESTSDGMVGLTTSEPTEVLHLLTSWAQDRPDPFELEGLTVARPSLEDVYLALTASEPEDAR